jgi:hypothetical protein
MALVAAAIRTMNSRNISSARCIRFKVMEVRSITNTFNTFEAHQPIASLGLMLDGCTKPAFIAQGNLTMSDSSVLLVFNTSVQFNGWWFMTQPSGSNPASDPIRFVLEASDYSSEIKNEPCGSTWRVVGASWSRWSWAGNLVFQTHRFDTPLDRGKRVIFDHQVLNSILNLL